jgi:hypothetical protein
MDPRYWLLTTDFSSLLVQTDQWNRVVRTQGQTFKPFVGAPLSSLCRRLSSQSGFKCTELVLRKDTTWYGPTVFCEEE